MGAQHGVTAVELVGMYWLLSSMNVLDTMLILFLLTGGAIFAGRDYFEGMPYQVSYAAYVGDALLMIAILGGCLILPNEPVVPKFLNQGLVQEVVAGVIFLVMAGLLILKEKDQHQQWMDVYHDLFIVPLLATILLLLAPVVWFNGSWTEVLRMGLFVLGWVLCVVYDTKRGSLNQRPYMEGLQSASIRFLRGR